MGCNRESLPSGWDKWEIRLWEAWKLLFSFSQNENYSLKCTFICKFYVFPWKECIFFWKHSPVWGSGAGISCCLLLSLPNSSTAYFKSFSDGFWMNLVGVPSTPLGDALVGSWWEAVPVPGAQISPGSLHGSGMEGLQCTLTAAEALSVGWLANGQLCWKEFLFLDDAFLIFFFIFFFSFLSLKVVGIWFCWLMTMWNIKLMTVRFVYSSTKSLLCVTGHYFLLRGWFIVCDRLLFWVLIFFFCFSKWNAFSFWKWVNKTVLPTLICLIITANYLNSSTYYHPHGPFRV